MWWLPLAIFAHVAPSPDADNRYVKVTLLPGHARIAYLVFLGERPGTLARARMDTDGDGLLSDAEARVFGQALLGEVAPRVAVTLDGAAPAAAWSVSDVGLGTPTTSGGAFSVDLVLSLPYTPGRAEHTLTVADGWRPPQAGEAELRIETGPEVSLIFAHRADAGRGVQTVYADPLGGPLDVRVAFRAPVVPVEQGARWPYLAGAILLAGLAVTLLVRQWKL